MMAPTLRNVYHKTVLTGCFLFCTILISLSSYAQHGYTPGFIIKQSGDTVSGFIKQRNSKRLLLNCRFKATKSAKPVDYKPSELSGFRFESGKYYITREYKTENDSKLVFMEYLIKGKANMFYFRDGTGDHYMLEKEGDKLIELTEPQKTVSVNSEIGLYKPVPKYKGKLIAEFVNDCNDLKPIIEDLKLSNPTLIDLAKRYHDCVCTTESCIIYEKEKPRPIVSYSLTAGYLATRYNFGDRVSSNYGSGFQAGVEIDIKKFLFSDEKFGFSAGIFFERDFSFTLTKHDKQDFNGEDITYKGKNYTIDIEESLLTVKELDVALNVMAIKVPIFFKYGFTQNAFALDGGIGLSNRFIIKSNNDFSVDRFDRQYGKTFRRYHVGPAGSIKSSFGLKNHKALTVNLLGEYLINPNSVNQFLRLNTTQFTLRIGYTL